MTHHIQRSLLKAICCLALICATHFNISAQDLGNIELGVRYPVDFGSTITGTFTAPSTGELIVNGDVSLWLDPSHNFLFQGRHTDYTNGGVYQYAVTEGTTYYLYQSFNMNSAYILLEMDKPLEVTQNYPQPEFAISSAGYDYVDVWFNQSISVDHTFVSTGDITVEVDPLISNNKIVSIPFTDIFDVWYADGTIVGGETVTFTITGIRDANGNLYKGTGEYSIDYRAASAPLQVVSKKVPSTFYSYYQPGDPKAIVSLTFDGDLLPDQRAGLTITYGDIEQDVNDFYMETIYGVVDGPTVTFDLAGKLRSPKTMIPSGTDYGIIAIQIGPIYAADGSFVDSGEQGSMGAFNYTLSYVDLKYAEIISDFLPANGSDIYDTDEIEIWVSGINALTWDGVIFEYDIDGVHYTSKITKQNLSIELDGNEATITVPVAAEIRSAQNVVVSLAITGSTDGFDHSGDVKAMYNSFTIIYSYPAQNAQVASLDEGEKIVVRVNSEKYYILYRIDDLNPIEEGEGFITAGIMTLADEGDTYTAEMFQTVKFYTGHTYALTLSAYENETAANYGEAPRYERTITWQGTSVPVAISDILFVSVNPADGTTLTSPSMNTFKLIYDGLVMIDTDKTFIVNNSGAVKFESIIGTDAAENEGFANTWTLTVPQDYMETLKSSLDLSIRAYDMQGRLIEGNVTTPEDSYLYLSYPTTYNLRHVELLPAAGSQVKELSIVTAYVEGDDVNLSYSTSEQPVIKDANGDICRTLVDSEVIYDNNTMVRLIFETLNQKGEYTLSIPAGYFIVGSDRTAELSAPEEVAYTITTLGVDDITVTRAANTIVVYNTNGVRVLETTNPTDLDRLPAGVYIERRGNTTRKVLVVE